MNELALKALATVILVAGLAFLWKRGDLEWIKKIESR